MADVALSRDKHVVAAFEKGCARGRLRHKFGRGECPYGPTRRADLRDAWFAGYDFGYEEGPDHA